MHFSLGSGQDNPLIFRPKASLKIKWLLLCLMSCAFAASALAETNAFRNPSFEVDGDSDGIPDEWRAAGDTRSVTQSLSFDRGRDGKRCTRLSCTRFRAESPASHAMLCQMGVPVRKGASYRVTLWARGEGIMNGIVSIDLKDTSTWASCGLRNYFTPGSEWERFEFLFRATHDCSTKSRFQIWFNSTGTLWVDDVEFVDAGPEARRPGQIISAGGRSSLVPNGSFECGTDGWGSAEEVGSWGRP